MADIILLVYDITDQNSFDEIEKWFKMIKENCTEKNIVLSIIANKIDLESERKVFQKYYADI